MKKSPVCVELLYNEAFLNNEYLFNDLVGVNVEHVMNYNRPYLARADENGKISDGEKYLLKQHTEEIPTISGTLSFDMIIPFTIDQVAEDFRVNKDIVDSRTHIIKGLSSAQEGEDFVSDSGVSELVIGEPIFYNSTVFNVKGDDTFTVINADDHLMSTRSVPVDGT